ncbi:aldehyde dehydrogenase [Paenibacillus sp. N1-5-1-14]|uniref:aldehyde dehydrogenase n=1 Tax=Paenibacillus radicibacter TaxID=2972488 RepID=UPI0021591AE8|nr:aldehyde dehydrogenase [Paenibacillus radicibacter]MCR8644130.1 aldehyde dehydrogenase [Paenibacillus radicibacter]
MSHENEGILQAVQQVKDYHRTGVTLDIEVRIEALRKLQDAIRRHEPQILEALKLDLNKSKFEAYSSEVGIVLAEIRHTLKHIRRWAKPKRTRTALIHFGARGIIYPEPFGTTLVIAPWNYPFQLSLAPVIGAIAAGNCVVLKPSEQAPHTSAALVKLVEDANAHGLPKEMLRVIEGDVDASTMLLREEWDYIFFTGGPAIGKIVMEAASKHLTPVTLELGGKSPCIVHHDANIKLAAKRIVWGKFLNSGQTCVAPDYVLVHETVHDALIAAMQAAIAELYGGSPSDPRRKDLPAIVNGRHYRRLRTLLDTSSGTLLAGGGGEEDRRYIEPTILGDMTWEDPVMQEEIFGPILPVLKVNDLSRDVIAPITARPKPLALYLFSESKTLQQDLLRRISFGCGAINDTVIQFASTNLPIGGVGNSGMGRYHGKDTFDLFSHHKSVLHQTTRFDLPFRYPTMKNGYSWIKKILK